MQIIWTGQNSIINSSSPCLLFSTMRGPWVQRRFAKQHGGRTTSIGVSELLNRPRFWRYVIFLDLYRKYITCIGIQSDRRAVLRSGMFDFVRMNLIGLPDLVQSCRCRFSGRHTSCRRKCCDHWNGCEETTSRVTRRSLGIFLGAVLFLETELELQSWWWPDMYSNLRRRSRYIDRHDGYRRTTKFQANESWSVFYIT